MHFHGAYLSNYSTWINDPLAIAPTSQLVWEVVGQGVLNSDLGGYTQGIYVTCGLFNVWLTEGIVSVTSLKGISAVGLILASLMIFSAYIHMHVATTTYSGSLYKKLKTILPHHISIMLGLGSLSWSGHQFHIALPSSLLLSSGVLPKMIPSGPELLTRATFLRILSPDPDPAFGTKIFSATWCSIDPTALYQHHASVGLLLILSGLIVYWYISTATSSRSQRLALPSWHGQLAVNLGLTATITLLFSYITISLNPYSYLSVDYPTVLSNFCHHSWIAFGLILGAVAHASIFSLYEHPRTSTQRTGYFNVLYISVLQREVILGHLIWVSIFLGVHSFGLLVHNDTMQALGRPTDTFSDFGLQLKPIFANLAGFSITSSFQPESGHSTSAIDIFVRSSTLAPGLIEQGTNDYLVHHVHAFNIHVTLLISIKGVLNSRSSRLVSDKSNLGFRYPCDGPGRGGTCQISSWDHLFLATFWAYNTTAVIVFHTFWKLQSDIWLSSSGSGFKHITSGDFAVNGGNINGWLRNFLWTESSQVLQSYATSLSPYGLLFLLSHFVWALSLMYLFSGRGYWQELIESLMWSHFKMGVLPCIQPRALSITQGRAVGLVHYILGGIGCTWSFFLARSISLRS
jgi:photosystem I P700 chlorophyll a apoprotein A1